MSKRTGLHLGTYESLEFQLYLYLHGENKVWFLVLLGRFWGTFLGISAVHELRITAESLLFGLKLWIYLGLVIPRTRLESFEIPLFMTFDPFSEVLMILGQISSSRPLAALGKISACILGCTLSM